MNNIIIRVAEKETINLLCTKCGNSRQFSVGKFSANDNKYRIQCRCGHSFKIMLDRRKYYRKKTDLRGTYIVDKFARDEIIDIIDLSTIGLCLVRRDNRELDLGQIISISFMLENAERDEIKCKATIRQIMDDKVGVEFLDLTPGMQKTLTFYLFNYVDKDTRVKEINFPTLPAPESAK
jgi:hypothetical protein